MSTPLKMPDIKIGIKEIFLSSGSFRTKALKLADLLLGTRAARFMKKEEGVSFSPFEITSVLVIRPGGIGDAVFLLPFLRILAAKRPDLAVDILCEERNAQIFLSQPGLYRKIFYYDSLRSLSTLSAMRYTLIIDTEQWHYLSVLLARWLRPRYLAGFATRPLRAKLLNVKVPYEIDAYEIENFRKLFALAEPDVAGVKDIDGSFSVPDELRAWAEGLITKNTVTLFIGASIPERRFTLEQILQIVEFLLGKNIVVALIGGRDVEGIGDRVAGQITDPRFKNFVGKTSLAQSAALIHQGRLFIGPDSGLMHLACAVGTPVVAIFGPGNANKWAPRAEPHTTVSPGLSCEPCTTFGYTLPSCRGAYSCNRQIDIKIFLLAIEGKL